MKKIVLTVSDKSYALLKSALDASTIVELRNGNQKIRARFVREEEIPRAHVGEYIRDTEGSLVTG